MREGDLHALIAASNARLPAHVLVPPGDDMAQVAVASDSVLVACDQVVEGLHFVSGTPLELVARKAIARNVSDAAAMAGTPFACVCSATVPVGFGDDRLRELTLSLQRHAEAFGCPLVGGDTSWHRVPGHPLQVSITILAAPHASGRVVRRSDARAGDDLFVTGALGGTMDRDGMGHHLTFTPRGPFARALVGTMGDAVGGMIDLSDGLGRDVARLAQASGVGVELDTGAVPCQRGASLLNALGDGEDYELCFTMRAGAAHGWMSESCEQRSHGPWVVDGVQVTRIGRIVPAPGTGPRVVACRPNGGVRAHGDRSEVDLTDLDLSEFGWEHGEPPAD